jgi:hypothetical protein
MFRKIKLLETIHEETWFLGTGVMGTLTKSISYIGE